ncbi:uncharacterized protein LOC123872612 [Maniola jurtina]|uniref:uncharacterized protein LOC123872612 n=1 Tax=Maniola jurtina TaxID=191418 RepID=UPI001E68B892|nr:uncharacterized protein LOC123872612 [Maniola jurtina]
MPVTRQQGQSHKAPTEQIPSTSEVTAALATETRTETDTAYTATGTVTTEATEQTAIYSTSVMSAPFAVSPSATVKSKISAATHSITPSFVSTLPVDAKQMNPPATGGVHTVQRTRDTETSTVKKGTVDKPQVPRAPSKKGGEGRSNYSKTKAHKIAKAKEELLRLQVELAAARLAALETEETDTEIEDLEDDGVSVHSNTEVNKRVDNWLDSQPAHPVLAITDAPQYHTEESVVKDAEQQKLPEEHQKSAHQSPAGVQSGIAELAEAITNAVKAAQRPKYIELPFFGGSHQEWLPFRAAYYETENMFSTVENINRLRRNLKGKAKEAVEGLLITSAHPTEIMKTLESRFGRPESIAMTEMETLRGLPRLTESPRDICIFATKVSNVVATLKTLSCVNYMYNPEVSKTLVDKLTPTLRYRFYDFAATQPKEDPDLLKLDKFLKREAELCGPYALPEQVASQTSATQQKKPQKVHNVAERMYTAKCPVCGKEGHNSTECEQFKNLDENERWDTAKSKRLCFRCLRYRTKTHRCRVKVCGINSCRNYHHKMLHYNKTEKKEDKEATEVINSAWMIKKKQSFLKIIPVQVEGPRGTINTFALLDDGSTVTLIDNSVAECIGAPGPVDPLKIETLNDTKTSESASRRVTIKLRGLNDCEEQIQARTVKNLQVSSQQVSREMVDKCKHLADIRDYLIYADVKPRLLIGQDNWHLLLTTEVRRGDKNQLVASLTPLGWVLHGSQTRTLGRRIDFVSHVAEEIEDNLDSLIKQYFEMDALCIQPKKPKTDPEERAQQILEKKTKRTAEGRYETGLLWRKEDVSLPENYESSLKRLFNIEKKIDRDPKLKQKYTDQMEALISKGYAEPAPKQKTAGKTWYLPHFAVINPMKPEKLRVVHDAAAKTKGVALNDMLLKGPDLLQFRQHMIAVTADIKEMFMQVKLRTEDRDALRYLWRGNRRDDQPPEEYRMTSLIFGASSSPSTAIYLKNLNAKQYEETHPEATAAIIQKHYVDDYLDSFRTLEDAVRIAKSVREVHSKASFELKQWKSNSSYLLEALGEKEQTEKMELYKSEEKTAYGSKPDCKVFWTNSKTVLTWIRTVSHLFKPYVAHHLAAIVESSKVTEWRRFSTKLNVTDDTIREVPATFNRNHRWYKGPDFLYETEAHWPTEVSTTDQAERIGEEKINHVTDKRIPKLAKALPEVSWFSNRNKLRRATAEETTKKMISWHYIPTKARSTWRSAQRLADIF